MNLSDLQTILGIKFKDEKILAQALTHRSFLNEDKSAKTSNERLEFLGDSVLSLLTSTEIYKRFPEMAEGKLTNLRSILVRTETLAKVATTLEFGKFLFLSKGEEKEGGRTNISLLADMFEAVLGAIYLDRGLDTARDFLSKHLFSQIDSVTTSGESYDYKSRLQEIIQEKKKITPIYKVIKEEGPDHDKTFTVEVMARDESLASGEGKSKQEAEQAAARIALQSEKM